MKICNHKMRKITAIFQESMLQNVESVLCEAGVGGFTVTSVKGCGEYKNYYSKDLTSGHSRIEIFIEEERVENIVATIMGAAHLGSEGDGIVAVLPVESLYRIRTQSKLTA